MELNVGHILQKTVDVIRANLGTCLALVLVVASLDVVAALAADVLMQRFVPESTPSILTASGFVRRAPIETFLLLVTLLSYLVAQAGMTSTVIAHSEGHIATITSALGAAFDRPIAVCVGGLFTLLATMVGTLLLIVPGVLAAIVFCLTTPAILAEKLGPIEAMKRSKALASGHAHGIFFVFLAISGIQGLVSMAVIAPLAMTLRFDAADAGANLAFVVVAGVVNALCVVFATGVIAVVYAEVRD